MFDIDKINFKMVRCKNDPCIEDLQRTTDCVEARWFYDKKTDQFMWVIPELFFSLPQEKLEKCMEQMRYVAGNYCEMCESLIDDIINTDQHGEK